MSDSQGQTGAPVVTLDGPTASGKGAVAQKVAAELGWHYLDSGALYRLVALVAARQDCRIDDEHALAAIASALPVTFDGSRILLQGEDVSTAIREPSVGNSASRIAVFPEVRNALLERQRAFARPPGLVADGRDMASVVFPTAILKLYLTASVDVRAHRRHKQLIEKGFPTTLMALRQELEMRDARDANRAVSPLVRTGDSHEIDSSSMDLDGVVRQVVTMIRAALPG